jgi:hypothetical protein
MPRWRAHKVPPIVLDRLGLVLHDQTPHEIWDGHSRVQLKVERDVVFGTVQQVDESIYELVRELKQVVTRSEREDCVQGRDVTSAGRKVEEIRVSVGGEVARGGTRELLLEDVHVRVQPVGSEVLGN